ncbi:unnamed protein product, partial [Rhizoctonia solani]
KYRSKYLGITFQESATYTPPALPVHVSIRLEPVTGAPSEEQVIKVQDAIRLYHQFSNASHTQRARNSHVNPTPRETINTNLASTVERAANPVEEPGTGRTNNIGTGADAVTSAPPVQPMQDPGIRDAIERSNRLAEQANQIIERSNQLVERSNQIAERSNQLAERSSQPADQSDRIGERFNQLFERLDQHLEQSNELAKESTRPVEKIGDVLGNINKVLVRIQHAIVRNHKGNTVRALDCLVNEKGETPGVSHTTPNRPFASFSKAALAMAAHPGWYPPRQVCSPPELPAYLREAYALKPIVGIPNDDEVIGIHSVIHAVNQVSVVPGMRNPSLLMNLSDHLFSVQMARYRIKYSLITFPTDATYTPPNLPAHITVNLAPVSGTPTDEELMKVQDAFQTCQDMRRFPSMFDAHVNMELSQHLFDLQMARHMRLAGESQPSPVSQWTTDPPHIAERAPHPTEEVTFGTNNAGMGADATIYQPLQVAPGVQELMEQSNRLAERFNQLLERSNELAERPDRPESNHLFERFGQVLERLAQLAEQPQRPAEPDRLAERFNQLLARFNQVVDQSNQPAEQLNRLAERVNELIERSNQNHERPRPSMEELGMPLTKIGDILGNINRVLVRIQHAIVRSHKGNNAHAVACLVNEKGEAPGVGEDPLLCSHISTVQYTLREITLGHAGSPANLLQVVVNHTPENFYLHDHYLGHFLHFYNTGEGLCDTQSKTTLLAGKECAARKRLENYFSSCLG